MTSTRERIVEAAARVLTERGIVGATTREIARAAGCSEALLYKHFADKQEIFIAVLSEQLPRIELPATDERGRRGENLAESLAALIATLLEFFARTFPMAVSIFGAPALLAEHREGIRSRGFGPEALIRQVERMLRAEQDAGRIRRDADLDAAARMLVGFAFHRAFLSAYDGETSVADARGLAERGAAMLLPALQP